MNRNAVSWQFFTNCDIFFQLNFIRYRRNQLLQIQFSSTPEESFESTNHNQLNSRLSSSVQFANGYENVLKLNMPWPLSIQNGNTKNYRCRPRSDDAELGHFGVLVTRRTAKKCTKICNARAWLLFYSYNFLFGDVLAAVVCLISLIIRFQRNGSNSYFPVNIMVIYWC